MTTQIVQAPLGSLPRTSWSAVKRVKKHLAVQSSRVHHTESGVHLFALPELFCHFIEHPWKLEMGKRALRAAVKNGSSAWAFQFPMIAGLWNENSMVAHSFSAANNASGNTSVS